MAAVAAPTQAGHAPGHRSTAPSIEAVRLAFPHLEILELIGQGGMGAVFKARQPKLNRFVALKILPESMARDPSFAERLAREGQLLARLSHPNVVSVHDFGSANGFFYLLMEYVDGVNLRQAMQAGRFTAEQALAIVPMICEALQYAHDEGVLHRDIKPENILLDTKGRVKLVDFGIAKLADRDDASSAAPSDGAPSDSVLTQSGSALGTPSYMAPEQRSSPSTVDPRADIYSLGVVFYEMLTGELPTGNFAPPSTRTPMDPRVDEVVMRAMARQKEQRFRTAAEIRTCVETITRSPWSPTQVSRDIPTAAVAYPVRIGQSLKHALTLSLGLLCILMLVQCQHLPTHLVQQLAQVMQGDWLQRSIALVGLAGVGWLAFQVWRRRAWFTEALRPVHQPLAPTDIAALERESWTRDLWLPMVWLGVLGLLAIHVLWMLLGQVFLVAQSIQSLHALYPSPPYSPAISLLFFLDVLLFPVLLLAVLTVGLVRRELHRTNVLVPPVPAPAWMPRAAFLTVVFVIVSSLPVMMMHFMPGAIVFTSVSFGELLVVLALALLTRSRIWRAIALVIGIVLLASGLKGLAFFLFLAPWEKWSAGWSHPLSESSAIGYDVGSQILGLFCCAVGVILLLLPSTRAAFGLPARGLRPKSSPQSGPAA